MIAMRCLCLFTALLLTWASSLAKRGGMHSEDRYNPQHIDGLPPEIRNAIYHKCSTPKALHDENKIVFRFVVLFALAGLTAAAPTVAQARGGPLHLFGPFSPQSQRQPVSRAGTPTPSAPPSDLLAGCGRGRYRDAATHRCRGPADVQ